MQERGDAERGDWDEKERSQSCVQCEYGKRRELGLWVNGEDRSKWLMTL
jgi:hypothetical protein